MRTRGDREPAQTECNHMCYTCPVIKTFRHQRHREVLQDRLKGRHSAKTRGAITDPADHLESGIDAAGYESGWMGLASTEGDLKGHWSVSVNGNWRLTFTFEGEDAILVDYQDYH